MELNLNREDIFKDVVMNVSVIARSLVDADGKSLYDKVVIQERDKDFLSLFWDKAIGELSAALCDFVVEREGDAIELYLNDRTNASLVNDIQVLAARYMCHRMVYEWLKVKAPEYADNYLNQSEEHIRLVKEKLYYKNVPTEDVAHPRYSCCLDPIVCLTGTNAYRVCLYKDVILEDIEQELFGMYKRRKDSASTLMANNIELHHQLTVYINKHTKRLCERVSAYLVNMSCGISSNNIMDRVPVYEYLLDMPRTWNEAHAEQLAEEMHTYVVNASLYDFLKTNYPDEALIYRGSADASWDNVKHAVTTRKGGFHKPLQPF